MNWFRKTFEVSHTSHKAILSMEGIRGFAVFLVFLVHYVTLIQPWLIEDSMTSVAARHVRSLGNVGVDLFFVLSGYLIYGMLIKGHRPFLPYLRRRAERIYPTFTVVFSIYLLLSFALPSLSRIPSGFKNATIFIAQNFALLPGIFDVPAIITVAWSLSYEFFYYLIVPLMVASLSLRKWNPKARVMFFLALSVILFWYFAVNGGLIRLLMFVPGIVMYEVIANKMIVKMPAIGLAALLAALGVVAYLNAANSPGWLKYVALYVLFLVFCLECFMREGLTARLFSWAPLRWLGNMSYSYYLIHGLALNFVFLTLSKIYPSAKSDTVLFWIFLLPAFFLTMIPSAILFIYVEKPWSLPGPQAKKTDPQIA